MKGTGIESSRPSSLPPVSGSVVSVLLHAGVIAGVVAVQAHVATLPPEEPLPITAQFLYPLLKPMPKPVREQISFVGLDQYVTDAQPVQTDPAAVKKPPTEIPPPPRQVEVQEVRVEEPPKAFTELEVDSAAIRDPSSAGPAYPLKLLELKLEGSTTARFIVDSTGHVDVASLEILESSHPDFTQAVRDVLPRMRYQPARMGRRPVAQLVEQRFGFRIAPPGIIE
ncbi:MAG: energy transducer TonB [Gemmatimonas sp.]